MTVHRRHTTFATIAFLCCAASATWAETYHVSPSPLEDVDAAVQFRKIGEAAHKVQPGDTVRIHTGTYREQVYVPTSGTAEQPIVFEAAPAAHVVVTGADRLLDWRLEGTNEERIFSAPFPYDIKTWGGDKHYPKDDWHALLGRMEQVFVDHYPMRQVLKRAQLSRGTFWIDEEAKRLWVWASNNAKLGSSVEGDPPVEASVRPLLWQQEGAHVTIRGLHFRRAGNQAQGGAVNFKGNDLLIEDCTFTENNTNGASFTGERIRVNRCTFERNGQQGWSAYRSHGLTMVDSVTRDNNTNNFNRSWEAGGNKIVMARDVVIERCTFSGNRGVGLWFDVGNENAIVRNCLIENNENVGLFYEISFGMHAHDNVIVGNGFESYGGAWGASGGLSIASSPGCVIERNLIVGNKEGFQLREHLRTTPKIGDPSGTAEHPVWNRDAIVRNNTIALNRDGQIWAWFETGDLRYWPAAIQGEMQESLAKGMVDNAEAYKAKHRGGVPDDLSLETLNLKFENNLLWPSGKGTLWNWGLPWAKHRRYADLEAVRHELSLDSGSTMAAFEFANFPQRDFRVPADSPALQMGAYPKGEVPGVRLGKLE
ncbi:MAG TPA: right-handed parallel beta-helix repeat-containing protein [Tepidisphaeraceae bacterium]|jgi:hypothetical protein|nr:right-handed parallel beta-helix repeat-containing protein [Tepidisphaeraceae bacterium]